MNHFAMKQNAFAACEEMRGSSIPVFCPKPRRVRQVSGPDSLRSIRWHASPQSDFCDKAGAELLDIFLTKGGEIAMSPPFFAGSPPTRSANPVVHDARFTEDKPDPLSIPGSGSLISPRNKNGCARTKFGFKPAPSASRVLTVASTATDVGPTASLPWRENFTFYPLIKYKIRTQSMKRSKKLTQKEM